MTIFTGLAWSLAALLVIRFLFGIAEGPYPPAAMKQVAQDFPLNKRAQLTAALISSNYAGAALAPSSSCQSSPLPVGVRPSFG